MAQPLMPHATASWLVDNTSLSFEQIAEFCGLHILEIQAIAEALTRDRAACRAYGQGFTWAKSAYQFLHALVPVGGDEALAA